MTSRSERNLSAFKKWMINNGDSEKTVKSYSITVINAANKYLSPEFNEDFDIYNISSLTTINSYFSRLRNNPSWIEKNKTGNGMYEAGLKKYEGYFQFQDNNDQVQSPHRYVSLPKPLILLAGISGTGKTRFVRLQANASASAFGLPESENYCLVSVRPDWHEPSDLLGYVSRLNGIQYVVTDFLKFTFKTLCAAVKDVEGNKIVWKSKAEIPPYWLCLDEMNLAPVEQYFADYLSIVETSEWIGNEYTSAPLLKPDVLDVLKFGTSSHGNLCQTENKPSESALDRFFAEVFSKIQIQDELKQKIIVYVTKHGLPLPPNLIVAGTVNMDETTHGFSRKVIDRALSMDFGEFFPNDFDAYFDQRTRPKMLSFPTNSDARQTKLPIIDSSENGSKSVVLLKSVNLVLAGTPFELAYRALNELLLSVVSFNPKTDEQLQAVWDDYLMCKVLPRIDGDTDKLTAMGSDEAGITILDSLIIVLAAQMPDVWEGKNRIDLLRESTKDNQEIKIECRSRKKLNWMKERLDKNTFTSFWP